MGVSKRVKKISRIRAASSMVFIVCTAACSGSSIEEGLQQGVEGPLSTAPLGESSSEGDSLVSAASNCVDGATCPSGQAHFEDPSRGEQGGAEDAPLLGSTHGGHLWSRFCEGQPDDAVLPVDPRTRVEEGTNQGRAVYFNAPWVECDGDAPATCGEYRARLEHGREMMRGGDMWFFGGNHTDAMLTINAIDYNNMWRGWGMDERPDNYDELVAERWGIPLGEERNPYPLPGEDPNSTDGGSGQLPIALTQLRDKEGRYVSQMSFNCHWCHSGKVGDSDEGEGLGTLLGSGNSLLDVTAGFGKFGGGLTGLVPVSANKVRGSGDILLYPAIAALDFDRPQRYNESLLLAPSQGSVDYPTWWNVGHRTRRFHDGSFAMDDPRPVMGFFMPIFTYTGPLNIFEGREWIEERDQDVQIWLEARTAPEYPGEVDQALAEAGALVFHTKDLWADGLDNPAPRPPGGNGSCAGCHGAYAPRFVQDPNYLEDPALEGIAAYVVPQEIIGTDPARAASLTDRLAETLSYSWWGYGTPQEKGACFGVVDQGGYLAPPLYGIWASAPYFHNGSVPDVWSVLKPEDRPEIWRRWSAPANPETPDAFMGYDTNLARAYDHERLGWKYDLLTCGDASIESALNCRDLGVDDNPVADAFVGKINSNVWLSWNIEPQPSDDDALEDRKIYNTRKYSQGNQGHAFVSVLTDDERRALVEYLKTL